MSVQKSSSESKPRWRIYYSDGSTFDDDAANAPIFGVLIIVERCERHGRRFVPAGDYYGWNSSDNTWMGFDYPGLIQYLAKPGLKRVLVGEMVSAELWNDTNKRAFKDEDFPPKTGFDIRERKVVE